MNDMSLKDKLEGLSALEEQLKIMLADGFKKAVMSGSREDIEKMMKAFDKFKKGSGMLEDAKHKDLQKLGSLTVGEEGQKDFGSFRLVWKVQFDHIQWSLNENKYPQESWLTGVMKYTGWNKIQIESETLLEEKFKHEQKFESYKDSKTLLECPPCFQVYVHEWPAFKEAMDFLYYDLGRKSAEGSENEKSFIKSEA